MANTATVSTPPTVPTPPPASSLDRFMQRLLRVTPTGERTGTVERAQRAMSQSIIISGLRCLLTYLVIPLAAPAVDLVGSAGFTVGVVLALLGIFSSTRSMRAFWASNHRYRWHYTVFATIILTYLTISLIFDATHLLS